MRWKINYSVTYVTSLWHNGSLLMCILSHTHTWNKSTDDLETRTELGDVMSVVVKQESMVVSDLLAVSWSQSGLLPDIKLWLTPATYGSPVCPGLGSVLQTTCLNKKKEKKMLLSNESKFYFFALLSESCKAELCRVQKLTVVVSASLIRGWRPISFTVCFTTWL